MTDASGAQPAGLPAAGAGGAGRARRRVRLGRRPAARAQAPRIQPDQRLGGRARSSSPARVWRREYPVARANARQAVPGLFHHPQPHRQISRGARRTGRSRWAAWCGSRVRLTLAMLRGDAERHLHGEAPLRRGLDRRRPRGPACRCRRWSPWSSRCRRARYLRFDSFDSGYSNGWDLASAMHPQTILAYARNDQPLAEHGAPLRLYSPVKLGYKLTKYLSAMTLTAERPGGYWEDQGYPWLGGI